MPVNYFYMLILERMYTKIAEITSKSCRPPAQTKQKQQKQKIGTGSCSYAALNQ